MDLQRLGGVYLPLLRSLERLMRLDFIQDSCRFGEEKEHNKISVSQEYLGCSADNRGKTEGRGAT